MGLISRVSSRTYRETAMFKTVYDSKNAALDDKTEESIVYTFNHLTLVNDREAKFECPFKNHIVSRGKYMNHIYRCKKNDGFKHYLECPFHGGHWLPNQPLLEHHIRFDCVDAKEQTSARCQQHIHMRGVGDKTFDHDQYKDGWTTETFEQNRRR